MGDISTDTKDVDLEFALKYFINYKEKPDHVDFEHTYSQPCHKKYFNGYSIPAKYLFTVPTPNTIVDEAVVDEYVDIETLDHNPPLYFNPEKLSEQIDKTEYLEYDDNWTNKVDKKDWNIIKVRMFKSAVQILEADHLARLAYKGQRDEAVKRHLMVKKTVLRFKSLFGSVAWDPPTCQWLHRLILEKAPSCLVKVYTDAFQCLETKVPANLLEHMTIATSYMSVRSRLLGLESQMSSQKKHWDMFDSALTTHQPEKIFGDPLLVLLPANLGTPFEPNTRLYRFMTELSLLGTLVSVTCFKNAPPNLEIPVLLEYMISTTVKKIAELQTGHPDRSIVLIGMGASALLACHIAKGFKQKIAAVVCIGFNIFSMEGKITKTNERLLNFKIPLLFVIGQNATTATIDEVEEFRSKLKCKSGLIVVGGADDHLRVNHFLKLKCAVTQSIVDRCIINEISEFLNDIMQPSKVLVNLLASGHSIENKPTNVSTINPQFLKQIIDETKNNPNSPIIKEITTTLAQLQSEQKYNNISSEDSTKSVENKNTETTSRGQTNSSGDLLTLKKALTSKEPSQYARPQFNRPNYNHFKATTQYQLNKAMKRIAAENSFSIQSSGPLPVNFARKTRGGRRPYVRRTLPPKRSNLNSKMVVVSSYASISQPNEPVKKLIGCTSTSNGTSNMIENLTPDTLLDMPVVFADENDEENVINDVSLTSYQPK